MCFVVFLIFAFKQDFIALEMGIFTVAAASINRGSGVTSFINRKIERAPPVSLTQDASSDAFCASEGVPHHCVKHWMRQAPRPCATRRSTDSDFAWKQWHSAPSVNSRSVGWFIHRSNR